MVRACCVPGCKSGVNVPSHKFPKNPERCSEWIKSLNLQHLESYCASDLQKYKICHKHFREQDYNYSLHNRVLSSVAVPVLFATDSNVDKIANNVQQQQNLLHEKGRVEQYEQILHPVLDQNIFTNKITHLELIEQHSKPLLQQENLFMKYNTEEAELQNQLLQQQQNTNITIQDHENRLQKLEEQIKILTCPRPNAIHRRSKLRRTIRKTTLTSISRMLYEINNKLKCQNRYLMRLLKHRKGQNERRTISKYNTSGMTNLMSILILNV